MSYHKCSSIKGTVSIISFSWRSIYAFVIENNGHNQENRNGTKHQDNNDEWHTQEDSILPFSAETG